MADAPQGFDLAAAQAEGYSPQEIAAFLTQTGRAQLIPHGVQSGTPLGQLPAPLPGGSDDPTAGMSDLDQTLAGAGRGLWHTGASIGNLAGLVPDSALAEEKKYDAPLLATGAGRFGNIVGEAAATAPLGGGASAALERVAPALARSLLVQGATQGAVQGAATAEPGDRARDALVGALTGGALGGASATGRAAAYGLERSPAAQRLLDQGVSLTPGQSNPTGAMNQFEQSLESVPFAKQLVEGARDNAEHQWQTSVIQQGAAPGTKITPSGDQYDMLRQAYQSYEPLYDQARGFPVKAAIMNGKQGMKLGPIFQQVAAMPGTTDDAQKAAGAWLQNELTRLPANPTSDDLLDLRSSVRAQLRTARLSNDTVAQDKAQIFAGAEQAVTRSLNSQLPPQAITALQAADSAYGRYKVVENAVAASKDNVAGLTPAKLSQAVYNATPDQAYALGGGGTLRQLAQDGAQVFQNVSPPTGARVLTLGAGAGLGYAHPALAIPTATGALMLTATPTGRRIAAGQTVPQQAVQKAANALKGAVTSVPVIGPGIPGASAQLLTRGAQGALTPYSQQAAPAALAAALMYAQQQAQKVGAGGAENH